MSKDGRPQHRTHTYPPSHPNLPRYTKEFPCKLKDDIWIQVQQAIVRWEQNPANKAKKDYFGPLRNEPEKDVSKFILRIPLRECVGDHLYKLILNDTTDQINTKYPEQAP